MSKLDQAATAGPQPLETEPVYWLDDFSWNVFLLIHQFEVGCYRASPKYN